MPGAWLETGRRLVRAVGPPLVALALAEALLWAVAFRAGEDPRLTASWVRWDAYRYVEIARGGYTESSSDPQQSDTGWFSGYPLLMRLAHQVTHVPPARAGRRASLLFELALLVLLWTRLLPLLPVARRWLALMAAAFFPAWFYRHGVFPMSITTFFNLAAIQLGAEGQFVAAGACGALSALAYPTGFIVALPLAISAALTRGLTSLGRLRAAGVASGLTLAGLGAVLAVFQLSVGHWDAYVLYQERFGQGLYNPLSVLFGHAAPLLHGVLEPQGLVAAQTVLVTLLLLLGGWLLWRDASGRRRVDLMLATHAATVWLFVNAAGPHVSIYRQAAVLVSVVPLVARLPRAWLALLLAMLLALGLGMARLFFANLIV